MGIRIELQNYLHVLAGQVWSQDPGSLCSDNMDTIRISCQKATFGPTSPANNILHVSSDCIGKWGSWTVGTPLTKVLGVDLLKHNSINIFLSKTLIFRCIMKSFVIFYFKKGRRLCKKYGAVNLQKSKKSLSYLSNVIQVNIFNKPDKRVQRLRAVV